MALAPGALAMGWRWPRRVRPIRVRLALHRRVLQRGAAPSALLRPQLAAAAGGAGRRAGRRTRNRSIRARTIAHTPARARTSTWHATARAPGVRFGNFGNGIGERCQPAV